MSKENLFASIKSDDKVLHVYGYIPALELKKIAEDFRNGIEINHPQIKVEFVKREDVLCMIQGKNVNREW